MFVCAYSAVRRWNFPFATSFEYGHNYLTYSVLVRGRRKTTSHPGDSQYHFPVAGTMCAAARARSGCAGTCIRPR